MHELLFIVSLHSQGSFWKYFILSFQNDEKGIRCKSGTVPAAVSPLFREISLSQSLPLVKYWEGAIERDESEDLP